MMISSNSYTLQMTRKFPVLYYKNNGTDWQYQSTFYGTGPNGHDDYFGDSIAMKGNLIVLGAPLEGMMFEGKAYYLDLTLGLPNFEQQLSSIYPNPTHDFVNIKNNSLSGIVKTEIYSVTGHLLQTERQNLDSVSLEKFSEGLYFMKLYYQNASEEIFKIIKN